MDALIPSDAEAAVIGACLSTPDAVIVANETVKPSDFGLPVYRWLAEAVWECLTDRTAPTLPAVITKLKNAGVWSTGGGTSTAVSMADIDQAIVKTTEADIEFVRSNARIVAECAIRRRGKKSMHSLGEMFGDTATPLAQVQQAANLTLSLAFDGAGERQPDIASIDAEEEKRLASIEAGQTPGLPCGLAWLDNLTGGFLPGETWVMAAPYKKRKTTVALNMVLAAARAGGGVAIFTVGDSNRATTLRKLISMTMNTIMIENDEPGGVPSSKTLQFGLSSARHNEIRDAARERLKALGIRLYDAVDRVGDLAQAERLLRRDVALYDVRLFVYDHTQGCYAGKNDYERGVLFSGWMQRQAGELGVTGCALSQVNEDEVRNTGPDSYSPGIKGGGALSAMANVLLKVDYTEPTITVELKLARDAAMGTSIAHRCNPASGLILENN